MKPFRRDENFYLVRLDVPIDFTSLGQEDEVDATLSLGKSQDLQVYVAVTLV